jgi:hypothetical protein
MAKGADSFRVLAELLAGKAQPVIEPDRLAPSAFYDLQYRIFLIAATFEIHAKPFSIDRRRIHAARLKLLQFIGCRPWLLEMMQSWSAAQYDAQLSMISSQRLRRGFLGDQMHDEVVSLLVARGILSRTDTQISSGDHSGFLTELYSISAREGFFSGERDALRKLLDVRITNAMLEGW